MSKLDTPPVEKSYTILRIKRKRNEEPLDALVVEAGVRRKKSRPGMNVFQFAQTVEDDQWNDQVQQKEIQDHISQLARAPSVKKVEQSKDTAPPVTKSIPLGMQQQPSDSSRRYTIVQDTTSPSESPKRSQRIPSITKKGPSDYTVWDAVPIPEKEPELDSHMLEIQSMLNDYLKMEEPSLVQRTPSISAPTDDDDYVWDLFIHRANSMPTTGVVGTLAQLPPSVLSDSDSDFEEEEDEADEDSNAEDNYKNDYPDEEEPSDSSEDEFHESSDHEEDMRYNDDGSDHEWR